MKINKNNISLAIKSASFPVLAASLVHVVGDIKILDDLPKPKMAMLGEIQGYLSEQEKQLIESIALPLLEQYFFNTELKDFYIPSDDEMHKIMNYIVGAEVSEDYVPMMLDEINLRPAKPIKNTAAPNKRDIKDFSALIIGAGMSGILMGIKLAERGIPFKIYEKNKSVGGTWAENTYPGCRVDIPNHFYSYSFEENHQWSQYFSQQPELEQYFQACFDKYDLVGMTQFNTEVSAMTFDDSTNLWSIQSINNGSEQSEKFNLVISCVGQLNQPKIPEINGLESFEGNIFHSARWPQDDQITGKKVAVIGSGASAFQIVPSIADKCNELTVFQRSAPWMFPNPDYHRDVEGGKKWLLENLPGYSRWYRFLLFWPGSDQLLDSLFIDPEWQGGESSINETNDQMRQIFTDAMLGQLQDKSLIPKVIPNYPPFGKRMLQDNGAWLQSLQKDNVRIFTNEIQELTPRGILSNNKLHEFDTIILATGFKAQEFFTPICINGGDGFFNDQYGDSPQSYLGIAFDTLPNFFSTYGPGTNLAHAGSIIFNSECQVKYICSAIDYILENNIKHLKVKQDVVASYQEKLEARLNQMVWQHPNVSSWYQNSKGKVVTTSPWRLIEYWKWTKKFEASDYEL
ncbi:NAD(P)/FAD-dependent oxidoreductase [Gammaproteobacteria bacterium]|nr:NAD(P)/FAD-dependent oxidoreductase [Gammaproteobacteria bacterium]MDB9947924.1 NAD(P)/FAD-dependent oxidoreductase [Gammaproteobacteria bacterium]